MGATVHRVDPRTGRRRSYYKADDGKLYEDYSAAASANTQKRFAGSRPDVFSALQGAWSKADRALGGWLPGGGTANPASSTVKTVSKTALGGGVLSPLPRLAPLDAAGYLGLPAIVSSTTLLQPHIKKVTGVGAGPSPQELQKQMNILLSGHGHLKKLGSGIAGVDQFVGAPPSVEPTRMVSFEDRAGPSGPHFQPRDSQISGKGVLRVNRDTPAWVWAHEMGHAVDHLKRPNAFLTDDRIRKMPLDQQGKLMNHFRLRAGGAGAGLLSSSVRPSDGDRSVLEAGVEGALFGAASNWDMLSKEVIADIHGRKIAKDAGVNWNNKQNAVAKASYLLHTAGPGFLQGAAGEILSRGGDQAAKIIGDAVVDPVARKIRGTGSSLEAGLQKYGFDPKEHVMDAGFSVRERHPLGKAVMRRFNP